jgi:hypothetical protein
VGAEFILPQVVRQHVDDGPAAPRTSLASVRVGFARGAWVHPRVRVYTRTRKHAHKRRRARTHTHAGSA